MSNPGSLSRPTLDGTHQTMRGSASGKLYPPDGEVSASLKCGRYISIRILIRSPCRSHPHAARLPIASRACSPCSLYAHEYDKEGQDGWIEEAFLGEIDWAPIHPISLPSLGDDRLRRMEQLLLKKPENTGSLEQWAARLKMSPRRLARLIRRDTQLTFRCGATTSESLSLSPCSQKEGHWRR